MRAFSDRGAGWYAVQTKPRSEDKVVAFLRFGGIPTFLPHLLVHHRHGTRRWEVLEPLFPGYLFAQFAVEPLSLDRVRWTPGVKRILGDGEQPVPVPEDVLSYLHERMGDRGFVVPSAGLAAGMRVCFRSGPFAYLEGIVERPASRIDRVRVLLQLMNGLVPMEVDSGDLESA